MQRRDFIRLSSTACLAAWAGGCSGAKSSTATEQPDASTAGEQTAAAEAPAPTRQLSTIGVQLYTVRDQMAKDVEGTFKNLSEIGFKEVEFAGYYGKTPAEMKALLDRHGLVAPSSHVEPDEIRQQGPQLIEAAKAIGHRYLVCAWIPDEQRESIDDFKKLAELFAKFGEQCKAAGIVFAYHNHAFEFEKLDGEYPYDVLMAVDADVMKIELDLYWVVKAGRDPLELFKTYTGRIPLCHVKDLGADGEIVDVGQGSIDFAKIFAASDEAGLEHYFVEHDRPQDSIATVGASYAHLEQLRF